MGKSVVVFKSDSFTWYWGGSPYDYFNIWNVVQVCFALSHISLRKHQYLYWRCSWVTIHGNFWHYNDTILSAMASQITGASIVCYRLLRRRSKQTSKLRVTGLCEGNPLNWRVWKTYTNQISLIFHAWVVQDKWSTLLCMWILLAYMDIMNKHYQNE